MNYDEVLEILGNSSERDWHKITAWGGGGPSFRYGYPDENGEWTGHTDLAVYKPDISLGLAWGSTRTTTSRSRGRTAFRIRTPQATSSTFSTTGCSSTETSGLSSMAPGPGFPLPTRDGDRLVITRWHEAFFGLIADLCGGMSHFDEYVRRAGFVIE